MTTRFYYVNVDLCHQYGISVTPLGKMSLAARRKEKQLHLLAGNISVFWLFGIVIKIPKPAEDQM